ncbi:hypothetical protein BZA77DRAFT_359588 [Pyronema omphalodes]|nr:hypothetical protein BZA77DRAFT_359588 [Pyronema omphalodes]
MPVLPRPLIFLGTLITLTTTTYLIRPIQPWETAFPRPHIPPPRPRTKAPPTNNIPLPFRKATELIPNGSEEVKRSTKRVDVMWWLELHFGPWRQVKHRDPRVDLRRLDIREVLETCQPWWMSKKEMRRREMEEAEAAKKVEEEIEKVGEVKKV